MVAMLLGVTLFFYILLFLKLVVSLIFAIGTIVTKVLVGLIATIAESLALSEKCMSKNSSF